MKPLAPFYFIFDVESIGLHGEAFAVAAQVFDARGCPIRTKGGWWISIPPGSVSGTAADHAWVRDNVPPIKAAYIHARDMRRHFWDSWMAYREEFPGIVMAAECLWPVEGRFLNQCVGDSPATRTWDNGIYPLHDIASIMLAAGMDPLATYERVHEEHDLYAAHHPLGDVKHSAWCLMTALDKLNGGAA